MRITFFKTRKLALLAILASLCLAIQLTPRPPNVEFTSFITFTVGLVCGVLDGAFFGCGIMFINGFLSPYGFAGLNMPFQMLGMAIAGILGGVYRRLMPEQMDSTRFCTETAVVGALIGLIFDLITNLGVGVQFAVSGMNFALAMLTAIAYGAFFSIIHIISNTAVFGILSLPSIKTLINIIGDGKIG